MLAELYITLAYMMKKDDADLWTSFRSYGMEQAKLAFLKLDELGGDRSFTSVDALREIAKRRRLAGIPTDPAWTLGRTQRPDDEH